MINKKKDFLDKSVSPMSDCTRAGEPEQSLEALRASIDAVDAELLHALNRRAALSLQVGQLKAASGAPVFCPEREASLLAKLVQYGAGGALPSEHLLNIYREILASSRALQVPAASNVSPSGATHPSPLAKNIGVVRTGEKHADSQAPEAGVLPSVGIIGIKGRMGSMLARRLRGAGYVVSGVDFDDSASCAPAGQNAVASEPASHSSRAEESLEQVLRQSRVVLLCVPVSALKACLGKLSKNMHPGQILMDITSVKLLPMRWMEQTFAGAVIGSHPMFGPNPQPQDMKVALVRGKKALDEDCALAESLFKSFGCSVFWSSATEHDTAVAFSQSLTFCLSAAFFAVISRQKDIETYLTPSFKRHLEAARMHLTADASMFLDFTANNPKFVEAVQTFRKVFDEAAGESLAGVAAEASRWYNKTRAGGGA